MGAKRNLKDIARNKLRQHYIVKRKEERFSANTDYSKGGQKTYK